MSDPTAPIACTRGRVIRGCAELLAWIASVGFLLYQARSAFFLGRSAIGHDNLYWFYPIYQFFGSSLLHGRFPYWDPFTHGGGALYPILLQLRLLEPVSYLVLALGSLATHDLVTLFNWDRLARGLVGAVGAYVLLRRVTTHWPVRLLLPPLLVWSSMQLTVFRQTGVIDQFGSAPWAAHFALRIVHERDFRWRNWIGFAVFTGTAWQSYHFAGLWILLLFLGIGFLLFRREDLSAVRRAPQLISKVTLMALVIGVMALPNAVLFAERNQYVFPARMLDHSYAGRRPLGEPLQYEPTPSSQPVDAIIMPFGLVEYTGTFSSGWDFVQLLTPKANPHVQGRGASLFGRPSEAFMYLGLLGYLGSLWGLAAGRHRLKHVWLLVTLAFGLLMLGPSGGVHWLLQWYPALWGIRHTHVFASFFVLGMLFFFVLGCNQLLGERDGSAREGTGETHAARRSRIIQIGCSVALALAVAIWLQVTTVLRPLPVVHWEVILLLAPIALLGFARRELGASGIFLTILAAHLGLVLVHTPDPVQFLGRAGFFLALPAVFLLVAVQMNSSRLRRLAAGLAAVLLIADLAAYMSDASVLWRWERPDRVIPVSALQSRVAGSETRVAIVPSEAMNRAYGQAVRYLSMMTRRPAGFSSIMYSAAEPEALYLSVAIPSESLWPLEWRLVAGRWQPGVARVSPDGVAAPEREDSRFGNGSVAARLVPSRDAVGDLAVPVPVPAAALGKRLWAQIWVRSETTAFNSVQVGMDFGTQRVTRFYQNSGRWERLTLDGPAHANPASLRAWILPSATAAAVFDDLRLRVSPDDGGPHVFDLDLVRSARRWNTFLMPTAYFRLLHSDIPTEALGEILALGVPLVQFRAQGRTVSDSELVALLRTAGRDERAHTVFLHPGPEVIGAPLDPRPAERAEVVMEESDYNSLKVTVNSPRDGYLYIAEGFDPHWRAYVDDRPAPLLRANMAFKAVPVNAGAHRIRLEYTPVAFQTALVAYFATMCLAFGVLLVGLFPRRNRVPV